MVNESIEKQVAEEKTSSYRRHTQNSAQTWSLRLRVNLCTPVAHEKETQNDNIHRKTVASYSEVISMRLGMQTSLMDTD